MHVIYHLLVWILRRREIAHLEENIRDVFYVIWRIVCDIDDTYPESTRAALEIVVFSCKRCKLLCCFFCRNLVVGMSFEGCFRWVVLVEPYSSHIHAMDSPLLLPE